MSQIYALDAMKKNPVNSHSEEFLIRVIQFILNVPFLYFKVGIKSMVRFFYKCINQMECVTEIVYLVFFLTFDVKYKKQNISILENILHVENKMSLIRKIYVYYEFKDNFIFFLKRLLFY